MAKTKKVFTPDFLQIPQIVMHLPPADRFVFGAVYFYSQLDEKRCKASNATIARVANISVGAVANSLVKLEELGFIKRYFTDETKKKREYMICLVSFSKVSSNDESCIIKPLISDSSGDEQNRIIKEDIKYTAKAVVSNFNYKEEVDKLLSYKVYWMNIIGIYIRRKEIKFTDSKQLKAIIGRNSRIAKQLAVFEPKQIETAMRKCEAMSFNGEKVNWSLETVMKQLS